MGTKEKFWIYLESYVFVEIKADQVLLYNTLDHERIESSKIEIIKLVKSIYDSENGGVGLLDNNLLKKKSIKKFVDDVRNKFMGDIIDIKLSKEKPIQLLPKISINNNSRVLKNKTGENILNYLTEITLYINTSCTQSCQYCNTYLNQFNCCSKFNGESLELDLPNIKKILSETLYAPIYRINIFGGDISLFNNVSGLLEVLQPYQDICNFNINYLNVNSFIKKYVGVNHDNIIIYYFFPIDSRSFSDCMRTFEGNAKHVFIISSSDEFETATNLIKQYSIESSRIIPFYTADNYDFFSENVFMEVQDIVKTSQINIFQNHVLNKFFFGKLIVLPNGDLKSSMNGCVLGSTCENSIMDVIYKEVNHPQSSWFKLRDDQPCSDCIYQYLCPPISNYEYVFKRTNLCLVCR
jgi:pseudo-rSAM protein